jgi:hypothetical protein
MHKLSVFLLPCALAGCSLVGELARPFTAKAKTDSVSVVAPSFTLRGSSARAQDSLRPRLEWIASRPLPDGLSLKSIAFRERADSSLELVAGLVDQRRLNSHGLDRAGVRALESGRIAKERPLVDQTRQAGIGFPLVARTAFIHRDYLFQGAKAIRDTVETVFPDSAAAPN